MYKYLLPILVLFSTQVFAVNAKDCENHAYFVYNVAKARDAGVAEQDIIAAVHQAIKEHPETGVTPLEQQKMDIAVDIVFRAKGESPERIANDYMQMCMSEVGI